MTQRGGGVGVAPSGLVSSFDGHVGAVTLANTDLDRVRAIVSKTANYTAADGDYVVGDTTGGAFTVTLPAAVAGGYIVVELRTGSPALTVHNLLGGDVILTGARAGALCFSDGTNWHAIVSEGSGTYVAPAPGKITTGAAAPLIYLNPIDYGAVFDGVAFGGGAMTSGSAVLTDTSNKPFVAGDVGKLILVVGAGASAGLNLWSSIASYGPANDGSQVTLAALAGQTVTGKIYSYGSDDLVGLTAWVTALNTRGKTGGPTGNAGKVPRGISFCSAALPTVAVPVVMEGQGANTSFGASGSVINFAPGVAGLTLGPASSYSKLTGIYLRSQSAKTSSGTTENGITCQGARVRFEDVIADGFGQDGFNFDTTSVGNADLCVVGAGCLATNNGRHGYYTKGPNSNVIGFMPGCSATFNTLDGFHNEGAGNKFDETHADSNGQHDYYDNANSSVWIQPYSEGGKDFYVDTASKYGFLFATQFGAPVPVWNNSAALKATWITWVLGLPAAGTGNAPSVTIITATNTVWPIPPGATTLRVTAVGGGGQGGGAGSAAAAQLQAGGGGGGAGGTATSVVAVGANTTLNVQVGAGGSAAGGGGTAGGSVGTAGSNGSPSSVTGTGISVYAAGGEGGGASAASSTTVVGGGAPAAGASVLTTITIPGQGGPSGSRSSGPAGYAGPGGGGGGAATATNGGSGGATAITTGSATCAAGTSGGSGTSAGGTGSSGPANTGQGGGGGGGGAAGTGAGGNGGPGGSGFVVIEVIH